MCSSQFFFVKTQSFCGTCLNLSQIPLLQMFVFKSPCEQSWGKFNFTCYAHTGNGETQIVEEKRDTVATIRIKN